MNARFYRHLARGEPVGSALTAARREAVRAGAPAAMWSGFVVIGDSEAAPISKPSNATSNLIVIPLVLLILGTLLVTITLLSRRASTIRENRSA